MLKKEFKFLTEIYGFEIGLKQKSGSYYFIEWTNRNICIMVLYDDCVENSVRIRVYDADSLGTVYDAVEYQKEFAKGSVTPRQKIRHAAEWLRIAIADKTIIIQ